MSVSDKQTTIYYLLDWSLETMEFIHNKTNTHYQLGRLVTSDNKKYDIAVILNWPTEADYENANDIIGPNLVDFYFGDYDDRYTAEYVESFIEKQNKYKKLLEKLCSLKAICPDDTEIDEQIEFVKAQIVEIY
jgi:hypothetical protein